MALLIIDESVLCGLTADLQPEPSIATLLLLLMGSSKCGVQISL